MRENVQGPVDEQEQNEPSDEHEQLSDEDDYRPHMRLPEFLYRVVTGVNPSSVTTAIRNALIGTAGIAAGVAASNYLGEQLSNRTGDQINTSLEPTVNALKDNLQKISTETALAIYNQVNPTAKPKETALAIYNGGIASPQNPPAELSNLIYNGIIGTAGANAAAAAYRLITDSLPFKQISRFIRKIKSGMTKPAAPQITADDVISPVAPVPQITSDDIIAPVTAKPVPDLVKPSKNPVNLFDLLQNQPIIPDTFASKPSSPASKSSPAGGFWGDAIPPPPDTSFPPVNKLIETDLRDLVELFTNMQRLIYFADRQIKTLEKKPDKTKIELYQLNSLKIYQQRLSDYQNYLSTFYIMKNDLNYRELKPLAIPDGLPADIDTLDKKELGDLTVKAIAIKNSLEDPALIEQIDNYILHLLNNYKQKLVGEYTCLKARVIFSTD